MAWGRKKSGGRKEPQFGLGASLSELRLSPQDRVAGAGDDEKPKKSPRRKAVAADTDDDDDIPRERKPRARRGASKRRSRGRSRRGLVRLFYWGVVFGLWAAIALVGVIVWVGAHLPPIQALEIPKRPPTIEIVGFDGSVLATRGEMPGANVSLKELPPYLPKAFIAIEDRRFYSHYGVEAAAQRYFGKSAKSVTIAEAAMLAGLVKSPSRLAPNRNPEGAEKRAQTVLTAMAEVKFITAAQAQASIGHPSYNMKAAGAGTINYVADWIGEVLDDLIGQIDQNIVVETSIDPKLQSVAEASVIDELAAKS
ncbi:MAG TPA: transglycosylase domain-containing protein, partial [Xanthobacteraceae bacterium]|nr:transglycosylase domain-containing protein [Xanthobacteraceae bacterium]